MLRPGKDPETPSVAMVLGMQASRDGKQVTCTFLRQMSLALEGGYNHVSCLPNMSQFAKCCLHNPGTLATPAGGIEALRLVKQEIWDWLTDLWSPSPCTLPVLCLFHPLPYN